MSTTELTLAADLRVRGEKFLMPNYGTREVALVRGKGCRAWDADGNEYLDFLSGIGVNNLGHCHPAVVEAIQQQAETLIHCTNGVLIQPQVDLAELLCTELGMDKAMFSNSGAEATEGAIKLVRYWSHKKYGGKRQKIMVFNGSFHGRTYGAMSATASKKVREGFEPLATGFVFANYNDIADVDAKWDDEICAVMLETVQGEGGVTPAEKDFLVALRERCTARGAALVCDEVQCGMARTGKRMAYQWAGVQPDVVPLAKALGGGFPIGALLARGEFADVFTKGSHGTTFGGSPLACAAALAATRVLFDEKLLEEVRRKGCRLWGGLEKIRAAHPTMIQKIRGLGMMQGLVLDREATSIVPIARRHGLIVNVTALNVVRLLPPLILSDDEMDEGLAKLSAAFDEFAKETS